jgi:eukaryotic-like serine/threonine-protein kinase
VIGPGDLVGGRYRLAEQVGTGAMGIVWRARDERLGRTVALKQLTLPAGGAEDISAATERIMREGRIAARLHHPNAISVFDVADHDGRPWLVMEYLPARSLAAVLAERGPLPPREVAAIGRQLADALAVAHAAGIVHRDIKPGNVLLAADGVAKLTDFGISRAVDDVTVTRTGMLSGTPAYLAPEVARGAEPSPASDVFALGSTLYAAVEGQPPFGLSDNALAVLHQVAGGRVVPPRRAGRLTTPLMQLLRTDPTERPTMAQACDALAALLVDGSERLHTRIDPSTVDLPPVDLPPVDQPPVDHLPQEEGPDRRPVLLIAAGVALAVFSGLLVLAATSGPEQPVAQIPAPVIQETPITVVSTPVPSTTVAPTTAPPTTAAHPTAPPPPTMTRSPSSAAELQQAVADYYALLPDHSDMAWRRLGPSLQAKGFNAYENFWKKVDAVQAMPDKVDVGSMTVRVLVVFRKNGRRPQAEVHDLVLIRSGDALLINGDHRLGGAPGPTTRKRGDG